MTALEVLEYLRRISLPTQGQEEVDDFMRQPLNVQLELVFRSLALAHATIHLLLDLNRKTINFPGEGSIN